MIIKELATVTLLMMLGSVVWSQHHYDFNWYIGYEVANPNLISISRFNFDSFSFHHSLDTVGLAFRGQNTTMSDRYGNLLFYSNGCEIRNSGHKVIPGSDPLFENEDDTLFCINDPTNGAMPLPNSMLSLPIEAGEDSTFYHIIQSKSSWQIIDSIYDLYSYYHEHLLLNNSNKLNLVYKDSSLVDSPVFIGGLQAIKHSNKQDWWLLYPLLQEPKFHANLITLNSTERKIIESSYRSPVIDRNTELSGQLCANLNGNLIAFFTDAGEFFYMSFDRSTGKIEVLNRDTIPVHDKDLYIRGAQFSPNGRFIYLGIDSFLYQLDTESPDFPQDPLLIAKTNKDHPSGRRDDFSLMQMGPDCKIYICTQGNTDFYHVIHRPNEKGDDCMVEVRGIRLKTLNNTTIPIHPNYRLGTEEENWCDSIFDDTTSSSYQFQEQQKQWHIWPNPADEFVKIGHEEGNFGLESVEIYTFQGQRVRERSFDALSITYEMNVSDLPEGIYLVRLRPKVGREEWHKVVVF